MKTLTIREAEIAGYVALGFSNRAIADTFGLSVFTVKNNVARIFKKLGCENRTQLCLWVRDHTVTGY